MIVVVVVVVIVGGGGGGGGGGGVCVCVCVCVFTTYFILINPPVSYNFKNLLSGYRAQLLFYDMTENSLR